MVKPLPWYKEGLPFKCTGCGQCCTGSPGYVWVDDEEIKELAKHLNISIPEFIQRYTHQLHGRTSLREDPKNYDCVFLKERRCTVYQARPRQCRTFPWWPDQLASPKAWKEAQGRCEGIGHPEAELVSLDEIQKQLNSN
jgi:hypothetical protein